ncbi:MAG: DUF4097 family beta strand repeat-containing protein [Candidatus Izemoplasmatales bacterium]
MKMKYIEDLKIELSKTDLTDYEINEIVEDFQEMINEALEQGVEEKDFEAKFGNPKQLASELGTEYNEKQEKSEGKSNMRFSPINNYNIQIELCNEDINLDVIDGNEILVDFKGVKRIKDYEINYVDSSLVIKCPKKYKTNIFNFKGKSQFNIFLPKNIMVDSINIININGDGEIKELIANKFKIKVTNGDYRFFDCNFALSEIETVNGDYEFKNYKGEKLSVSLVNGDLKLGNIILSGDFSINTVSGDVKINDFVCIDSFIKSVSGDINAIDFYPENLTLKTISGDVDIKNSDKTKIIKNFKKTTISGDIVIR